MTPKMLATSLSLVGVLGAGSAAALVNTQILDSGPTESGASSAVLPTPSSIDLEIPAIETSSTVPGSTDDVSPAAMPQATGYLTAYNVGDAGVVTVDVIDGRLVLVSAEPKTGWVVTKSEDDSNDDSDGVENHVEVEFTSETVKVEFEADFIDGAIVPRVESKSIGGTYESYAPGAVATSTSEPAPSAAAPVTTAPAAPAPAEVDNTVPSSTAPAATAPSTTVDDYDDDDYDDDDEYDDDDDDEYDDDEYDDDEYDDDDDDDDEWDDD